jgi:ribose transport system permease protein
MTTEISPASAPAAQRQQPARRSWTRTVGGLQQRYPIMQAAAIVVLFVVGSTTLSGFTRYSSIKTMLILASFLGIAAVGQQIVILLGGVDLAVPSFIALGNFMIAQLVGADGWPFVAAFALMIAIACVVGAFSGFICSHYHVQPLVVTLGIGSVVLGAVLVWTNGIVIAGVPAWVSRLSSPVAGTFGIDIPPVVVIWFVIALVVAYFLHLTVTGRQIYAAGSNPVAATVALVPIDRLWMLSFAISAVAASTTGVLLAGFSGTGDFTVGNPYLFSSLAAVIVGGTALVGARGDYWRTVLGALLLTELTTILIGYGFGEASQQIFYGLAIMVVVPLYGRDRRAADRV